MERGGKRSVERKREIDECGRSTQGKMKKEKCQGEPRCVFFSDKERPVRKKGRRDKPIEKKEDHCEGKDVQ